MAERRMFAKSIIDSDAFLDMPASAQALYFHLGMRADDDGFVNSPNKIMKMINSSVDDLKLLIAKSFLIPFESGVVVIKHWRIHNYIKADRYKPTNYVEEKEMLSYKDNGAYTLENTEMYPECIQNVSEADTQVRLGKDSIGKDNNKGRFAPPSIEEVRAYCQERGNNINPETFIDYYEARGWELSKGRKVKDWKACVRTWEKNNFSSQPKKNKFNNFEGRQYDMEELERSLLRKES